MDIICEKSDITIKKETKSIYVLDDNKNIYNDINDLHSSIGIKRIDSFDCNSSIHTFDPNKSSPPKKFFIKGNLRLDMY